MKKEEKHQRIAIVKHQKCWGGEEQWKFDLEHPKSIWLGHSLRGYSVKWGGGGGGGGPRRGPTRKYELCSVKR